MVMAAPPYRLHAAISLLRGDTAEAWRAVLSSQARNLHRLMRFQDALASDLDLAARLTSLEVAVATARHHVQRERADVRAGDPGSAAVPHERAMSRAAADLAALQDSLQTVGFAAVDERPDTAAVGAALRTDTALIGWLSAELEPGVRATWGYVVRRDVAPRFFRVDDPAATTTESEHRDAIVRYRDDLLAASSWPTRLEDSKSIRATAAAVYRGWLAPLLPYVGDADALIVVPSGPMLGVPVETLVDEDGGFLGDRFVISYAPSAAVHALLAGRGRRSERRHWRRSLVLGDPALVPAATADDDVLLAARNPAGNGSEDQTTVAITTRELREAAAGSKPALAALPRLPRARQEAIAVSELLPGAILKTDTEASEQFVYGMVEDGRLQDVDVIHIAAHALLDDRSPDGSAIALSQRDLPDAGNSYLAGERIYDGLLTAAEISRDLVLDADLVTLSACQTGLGLPAMDEGYLGLTKALFRAGSRCVLASLWKVADHPTELLMRGFYTSLANDPTMSLAGALQLAKRQLREHQRDDGTRPYEHPVYWGGFTLTGLAH
jgi:CHAT domain-containing protein